MVRASIKLLVPFSFGEGGLSLPARSRFGIGRALKTKVLEMPLKKFIA